MVFYKTTVGKMTKINNKDFLNCLLSVIRVSWNFIYFGQLHYFLTHFTYFVLPYYTLSGLKIRDTTDLKLKQSDIDVEGRNKAELYI